MQIYNLDITKTLLTCIYIDDVCTGFFIDNNGDFKTVHTGINKENCFLILFNYFLCIIYMNIRSKVNTSFFKTLKATLSVECAITRFNKYIFLVI